MSFGDTPPPDDDLDAPVPLPIDGILDLHAFAPSEVGDLVPEWIRRLSGRRPGGAPDRAREGHRRAPADGRGAPRARRAGRVVRAGRRGRRRLGRDARAAAVRTPTAPGLRPYAVAFGGPEQPPQVAEQRLAGERLLDELHVAVDEPVLDERVVGVAGHEEDLHAAADRRRARRRARRPVMRGMTRSVSRRSTRTAARARRLERLGAVAAGDHLVAAPARTRPSSVRSASSSSASTTVSPSPRGAAAATGDRHATGALLRRPAGTP